MTTRGKWAIAAVLSATPALAQTMQVEVPEAPLKERPQRFAPTVAKVTLGEKVEVAEKLEAWWKVQPQGKPAGWIAASALTSTRTKISADGSGDTGVSQGEEGLAVRPFDRQVEQAYREGNSNAAAGYAALDQIDRDPAYRVSDEQVLAFMKQGGLKGGDE